MDEVDTRLRWIVDTLHRLDFYIDQLEAHHTSVLRAYHCVGFSWREFQELRGVKQLENELACIQQKNELMEKEYNDLISWADMYRYCELDEKKMILANLFSRIEVSRDYDLDVQMTLTCEQFFELIHSEENRQEVSA